MFGKRGRGGPGEDLPPIEDDVLATLGDRERAVIKGIVGGGDLQARLENMGLRPGKVVTKLGAMPARGPVTVECDGFRVALGRGIAQRVRVERLTPRATADNDRG